MESSTLRVGDVAPEFSLESINTGESVSLKALVQRGPVVVEFLRGTW